ncbi:MAG TPA: DoxX family protein [Limnochordia bacterium]
MDGAVLVGRILFSIVFLLSGINHLTSVQNLSGYAQSKGVPAPKFWVVITGILLLLGGLSVLFGYQVQIGALILFIFLILAALIMHRFWGLSDKQAAQGEMVQFFKDLALAGAALFLYAYGPGLYSLG